MGLKRLELNFEVLGVVKMGVLIIKCKNFDDLIKMTVFKNNA